MIWLVITVVAIIVVATLACSLIFIKTAEFVDSMIDEEE